MNLTDIDIEAIIGNKNLYFTNKNIKEGSVILRKNNSHWRIPGGLCSVYKYKLQDGSIKALRIWKTLISESKERSTAITEHLRLLNSDYFVDFEYVENAFTYNNIPYPIVLMEWCDGVDMKTYIDNNIMDGEKIEKLANNFREMVKYFHKEGISHGDLHHENIMVKSDDSIVVIDYDSMFVPSLKGYKDNCGGYPGYQHPARAKNELLSVKMDYFSELVIYLSLVLLSKRPELWTSEVQDYDKELLATIDELVENENFVDFSTRGVPWMITKLKMFRDFKDIDQLIRLEEVLKDIYPEPIPSQPIHVSDYDPNELKKILNKFI